MKHLTQLDTILIWGIAILLIACIVVITPSSSRIDAPTVQPPGTSIPLSSGSLQNPTDIQGAASGLQGAATVTPNQLNQLNLR